MHPYGIFAKIIENIGNDPVDYITRPNTQAGSVFHDFDYDLAKRHSSSLRTFGASFDQLGGINPYVTSLSEIRRDKRLDLIAQRSQLYGIGELLDPDRYQLDTISGRSGSLAGLRDSRRPEDGVTHASVLPDRHLMQQVARGSDEARATTELASFINLHLTNVQISQDGGRAFSGTAYSAEFLRSQAGHFRDIAQETGGFVEALRNDKVMFFDTETTGVHANARVWEIHAKIGDEVIDLKFGGLMDGAWGPDARNFEDFMGRGADWIDSGDTNRYLQGWRRLLEKSQEAEYMVAQNAPFDMERVVMELDRIVASGIADDDFVELAKRFVDEKIVRMDSVVDTRALMSLVHEASNILDVSDGKRLSIESILTSTSALEDMYNKGYITDDALRSLSGRGLHTASVDVSVLEGLTKLLTFDVIPGEEPLLTGKSAEEIDEAIRVKLDDQDLPSVTSKIRESSAYVPIVPDGEGNIPIKRLVESRRQVSDMVGRSFDSTADLESYLLDGDTYKGYSHWAEDKIKTDGISGGIFRPGDSVFDSIRAKAVDAGIPFAGLSDQERLLSTVISQNHAKYDTGVTHTIADAALGGRTAAVENIFKEMIGAGTFVNEIPSAHGSPVRVHSGNIALSGKALTDRRLANLLIGGQGDIAARLSGQGDLAEFRLSFFTYGDGGRADVALNLVSGADPSLKKVGPSALIRHLEQNYGLTRDEARQIVRRSDDIESALSQRGLPSKEALTREINFKRLTSHLEKHYGLSEEQLRSLTPESINQRGVQVGLAGTSRNTTLAYEMAEQLGLARDQSDDLQARGVILGSTETSDGGRVIDTSPISIVGRDENLVGDVLPAERARQARDAARTYIYPESKDIPSESRLAAAARMIMDRPDSADSIRKWYDRISTVIDNRRPIALAAAAIFGGYYIHRKQREQAPYDEAMSFGGYERETHYEDYKEGMGEYAQPQYRQRHMHALETAGVVQGLDYHKVSHHNMSNDRHSHLFSF